MLGDAVSSGFACISRRFSAGLVGSSARKTVQWTVFSGSSARKTLRWSVFSKNGAEPPSNGAEPPVERGGRPPDAKSREINPEMQAKTP